MSSQNSTWAAKESLADHPDLLVLKTYWRNGRNAANKRRRSKKRGKAIRARISRGY